MEDNLENELDRSVITDNILLAIIPISDEKFGGSREVAIEHAKKAYIEFKTLYNKRFKKKPFDETAFARRFNDPISAKASASTIRLMYYVHNLVDNMSHSKDSKNDIKYLKNEGKIFSETSELMHLYHEHLVDEKLNNPDDSNEQI